LLTGQALDCFIINVVRALDPTTKQNRGVYMVLSIHGNWLLLAWMKMAFFVCVALRKEKKVAKAVVMREGKFDFRHQPLAREHGYLLCSYRYIQKVVQ
jgi:hypothetical protein